MAQTDRARVRYMVDAVEPAVAFYTTQLGFVAQPGANANFAILTRGNLELVLSTSFGPGSAAKPALDGRKAEPGGWNRILLDVQDLEREIARLRAGGVRFRTDVMTGVGGSQILLEDPSGNPVELFQAANR